MHAARTALIPLRPLTVGEILDASFLIVRRNARLMVGLPLVVAGGTAVYALLGLGLWFLLGNTTIEGVQIVLTVLMGLFGLLLLTQCLVWMTAILSRVSLQIVLGEGFAPTTTAITLRGSLPLFWPILGLSVLQYLALAVIQTAVSLLFYVLLFIVVLGGGATGEGTLETVATLGVTLLSYLLAAAGYAYISLTVPALATEGRTAPGWIGKPAKPTTIISAFERSIRLIGRRQIVRVTAILGGALFLCLSVVVLIAGGLQIAVLLFAFSINQDKM